MTYLALLHDSKACMYVSLRPPSGKKPKPDKIKKTNSSAEKEGSEDLRSVRVKKVGDVFLNPHVLVNYPHATS
jgi:hypothetical protein